MSLRRHGYAARAPMTHPPFPSLILPRAARTSDVYVRPSVCLSLSAGQAGRRGPPGAHMGVTLSMSMLLAPAPGPGQVGCSHYIALAALDADDARSQRGPRTGWARPRPYKCICACMYVRAPGTHCAPGEAPARERLGKRVCIDLQPTASGPRDMWGLAQAHKATSARPLATPASLGSPDAVCTHARTHRTRPALPPLPLPLPARAAAPPAV